MSLPTENNPLLIEKLRIQSGTQQRTSKEYADKLVSMALSYRTAENAGNQQVKLILNKN